MRNLILTITCGVLISGCASMAASTKDDSGAAIASAESAGPASLASQATISDWDGLTLREGSNGWTCLPDHPATPGTDPWCINAPWGNVLAAYAAHEDPNFDEVGVGYMLAGDTPVSNTDPYAF